MGRDYSERTHREFYTTSRHRLIYFPTIVCKIYIHGTLLSTVWTAHLPEEHPVEVGREVDVVPQGKPSDVAPQVRIGLVRNLPHHHHHGRCDPESNVWSRESKRRILFEG